MHQVRPRSPARGVKGKFDMSNHTEITDALPLEEPIPGAGADARMEDRPGVPMEKDPPAPAGLAHWAEPSRQRDPGTILKRVGLDQLTPVFGDTIAPRGVSGLLRKAAYALPEHYVSHWLLLLLSDRVDAVESNAAAVLPFAIPVVAGGLIALAVTRRRRRRSLFSF